MYFVYTRISITHKMIECFSYIMLIKHQNLRFVQELFETILKMYKAPHAFIYMCVYLNYYRLLLHQNNVVKRSLDQFQLDQKR